MCEKTYIKLTYNLFVVLRKTYFFNYRTYKCSIRSKMNSARITTNILWDKKPPAAKAERVGVFS